VNLSAFLFAAGQETTVRVMAAMLVFLCEDPDLQKRLRQDRSPIPNFVEETLRMEGTVKTGYRLAKVRAKVGEIEVEPGTPVMLLISAMNRDPSKFENPNEFQPERKNAREHLAFGRGIHACIGAPLARAELKVALERMFDRTDDIRFDERFHGTADNRNLDYLPSYMARGLTDLHLVFDVKA
jgi:cytochrome P450